MAGVRSASGSRLATRVWEPIATANPRSGARLIGAPGTYSGDTSLSVNSTTSCGLGLGRDELWYFATCPGATPVRLSTCGGTAFDSVLEIRAERRDGPVGPSACDDDDPTCSFDRASTVSTVVFCDDLGSKPSAPT